MEKHRSGFAGTVLDSKASRYGKSKRGYCWPKPSLENTRRRKLPSPICPLDGVGAVSGKVTTVSG